ncbi:MAG: alpha-galactosidase [Planctomycetia bacterium]|nr:alpha-galactosidase [Planctomycetia bacterium]
MKKILHKSKGVALLATLAVLLTCCAHALFAGDSPFDSQDSAYEKWAPKLVDDDLMPRQGLINCVAAWTRRAFTGQPVELNAEELGDRILIVVEQQDYSRLRFNETCIGQPFEFPQDVVYRKGLGTHANSRLRVVFPEPVAKFNAKIGINRQEPGSVRCAVEANGQTVYRSDLARGGEPARQVEALFDPPTSEIILEIDNGGDGFNCDQANWLEPIATTAQGKVYDLVEQGVVSRFPSEIPFSFKYNGVSSRDFLNDWDFQTQSLDELNDQYVWTDPKSKLSVVAKTRRFSRFAAVDWVLEFQNLGDQDSGLIEDVQVIDGAFEYGFERTNLAIHTLKGDSCDENSWLPTVETIAPGKKLEFAPHGGRPSNGSFPFWNIVSRDYDDSEQSEGMFLALGWTGQWKASFENIDQSISQTIVQAGMEEISTVLHPGESIRTPRVLVMPWRSDRLSAHALFRRLLMFEYAPKIDGAPVKMEIIAQCFDRYYRKRPDWEKAPAQIESGKLLKELGGTAYWFDAAWFPKGFPNGVGSWRSDSTNFPNGVEELGDALQQLGLRFILWFEPERVAPDSDISNQYPQYVFGGKDGGLYKLNDPEARQYLTELLLQRIREFKVGVYRSDFNIDPLPFWRDNDESNRKGMTEIRYVEGFYEMWNRILAENHGLWIDNCASGGRRIDLESIAISVPLWRSDTCCWPGHPEWDQNQTLGLAQYLPLFSCSAWDSTPYVFRSAANPGAIMQYNFLDNDFNPERARESIKEAKTYQKFWYGDFYPMSHVSVGKKDVAAWQLHRSDLNAGLVYVFRQENSPYPGLEFQLRALKSEGTYHVRVKYDYNVDHEFDISGAEFANYLVLLKDRKSACVLEYELVK